MGAYSFCASPRTSPRKSKIISTSIASYMVIASGTSQRHVASTAERVQEKLKAAGFSSSIEGEEKADWVLIDAFDVIVHIFRPEVREFYNLEKMWSSVAEIRKK